MRHPKRSLLALAALLASAGCSTLPRLNIVRDPLTPREHANLGAAYEQQGETALAGREYKTALRRDAKSVQALNGLGNLAFAHRDWKKAARYYSRALKIKPDDPVANNNLAMVYFMRGDREKARAHAEAALSHGGAIRPFALDTLSQINGR